MIIEEGIKKITCGMFCGAGLEKVTIPSSVEEIEDVAFCAYSPDEATLKKATIRSKKIKKWGKDIFGKAHKDLVIYVPKEKKEEYTKALRDGGLPDYVKVVGKTWGKKKKAIRETTATPHNAAITVSKATPGFPFSNRRKKPIIPVSIIARLTA